MHPARVGSRVCPVAVAAVAAKSTLQVRHVLLPLLLCIANSLTRTRKIDYY